MALGNQQDFEIHSGNDRSLVVTTKNAAGTVVNISTASAIRWQLSLLDTTSSAPAPKSDTALLSKAIGTGVAITDGPNGVFTVTLTGANTEALKGDFYYEADVVLTSLKSTVVFGKITIKRNLV